MAEIIKNIKKWFLQWTGIVLAMFLWWALYVFASSLTATDGETLTATKWNALVNQVNNSSADRVCPSWFVSVWSGYQLGCIQTALNPAKLWIDAAKDCYDLYWARLPSWNERFIAAQYHWLWITSGSREWIDVVYYSLSWTYTRRNWLLHNSWTKYMWSWWLENWSHTYRCFIPR